MDIKRENNKHIFMLKSQGFNLGGVITFYVNFLVEVHGSEGTGYIVSMTPRVHGFESMGYIVSVVLGYRVRGT